ncbi:MAG: helix-turn-helix domain-containing protein [Muribaculaceae bacterium]|nr:helix-turn-helix domain-containing protein [Muribaculaceae bacterium]
MNAESISSTQFADACRIPRPTLSQILSGRNKKISDEVIGKIHEAYPSLSIMWLLFGEGDMRISSNMQTSDAQNGGFIDIYATEQSEADSNRLLSAEVGEDDVFDSKKVEQNIPFDLDDKKEPKQSTQSISIADDDESATVAQQSSPRRVSIAADGAKSIINITVFYSDNSFQVFKPA